LISNILQNNSMSNSR